MRRALAALVLVVLAAGGANARSFAGRFDDRLTEPIAQALADSIGRSLPVTSASSGLTFRFDFATSAFERETDLLGQIYLERAEPLGRGKLNLAVSWQRVHFDTVNGRDLDDLRDDGPPIVDPQSGLLVAVPRFGIDLDVQEITTSITYGLTDAIDVNLTLPVLTSGFDVDAVARNVSQGGTQPGRIDDRAVGVGDLFLRGKYRFARGRVGSLATGFVLRLPAGNEDDFQGTGTFEVSPFLYASTTRLELGGGLRLQGYLNAGFDIVTTDAARSEFRFGGGLDLGVRDWLTLAVAVLGREPFSRLAPPGAFDVARVDPRTGQRSVSPLFGLDLGRPQYYELSLGGRLELWRDTLFLTGNVLLPITDDGFRASIVPLVGLEAVF